MLDWSRQTMVDIQFDNESTKVLTTNIGSHFVCRDVDGGELIVQLLFVHVD